MTRETKVGLLIGMGVILLIGIIVSDTLTSAVNEAPSDLPDFADQSQDSIFRPGPNDTYAIRGERETPDTFTPQRDPLPAPSELEPQPTRRNPADNTPETDRQPMRQAPAAQRPLPTALALNDSQDQAENDVPTLRLSHELTQATAVTSAASANDRRDAGSQIRNTTPAGSKMIHYVKRGETLYDIADQYYGSGEQWRALAAYNRDSVRDNGQVNEGARLVIPSRGDLALIRSGEFEPAGSERATHVERVVQTRPRTIKVETGDTLSGLAAEHLGSSSRWRELLEANTDQISAANKLRAGMTLKLPREAEPSQASSRDSDASSSSRSTGSRSYTVRSGDSLTRIAERELGDGDRWEEIYKANRDRLASPDSIKVGQTLRLP